MGQLGTATFNASDRRMLNYFNNYSKGQNSKSLRLNYKHSPETSITYRSSFLAVKKLFFTALSAFFVNHNAFMFYHVSQMMQKHYKYIEHNFVIIKF